MLHELAVLLGKPPQVSLAALEAPGFPNCWRASRPWSAGRSSRRPSRCPGCGPAAAGRRLAGGSGSRRPTARPSGLQLKGPFASTAVSTLFDHLVSAACREFERSDFRRRVKAVAEEVKRTRAVAEERLAGYRLTVLTAHQRGGGRPDPGAEAEGKHNSWFVRESKPPARLWSQATDRYRKGINDYLPVLTQLISVQDLERDLIQKEATLLTARI